MTKTVEGITSVERRRRWSRADKKRIVAATMEPSAVASEVARASDRFERRQVEQFERAVGDIFSGSLQRQGACHLRSRCRQQPYPMVTASNVNDITAAKAMPIEAGASLRFRPRL